MLSTEQKQWKDALEGLETASIILPVQFKELLTNLQEREEAPGDPEPIGIGQPSTLF